MTGTTTPQAAATRTGHVDTDGAQLYYEVRGAGPALLMISGAGGDAGYYSTVGDALADAFTVITYDRRGNSRSTGRTPGPMTITQQAADAHALVTELGHGPALVFGNSGGAIIAMALATEYPDSLTGLIAHEPPVVNILPDAQHWQTTFRAIAATGADDIAAAVQSFISLIHGEGSYPWPPELMQRFAANLQHLFTVEFAAFTDHIVDEAALAAAAFPIVFGAGSADRGRFYARASVALSQRTARPWVEFPGIHLEFLRHPDRFAAALRAIATDMISSQHGVPTEWAV